MTGRLKRRSSVGVAAHGAPPPLTPQQGPLDDSLAATDDESERKLRRGRHPGRVSLGGTPVLAQPPARGGALGATPTSSAISGYSAAQLAEHYANCMKLSAENKISVKNAFQLKLIDYMSEMLKKKSSDLDNFTTASCALDASTKIYGYRVDSIHNETMKLASGVGRTTSGRAEAGEAGEAAEAAEAAPGALGARATGKKSLKRSATVEKNLKHLNVGRFELDHQIDPLFKRMNRLLDSGSGGGHFLASLHVRDDSSELLLDSEAKLDDLRPLHHGSATMEPQDLPRLPATWADCALCPSLASFAFLEWADEADDLDRSIQAWQPHSAVDEAHAFQPPDAAETFFDQADDLLTDGLHDDDEGGDGGHALPPSRPPLDPQSLRDHLSAVPGEYSYFDQGRLGAWAGPKHWKFKPMPVKSLVAPSSAAAAGRKAAKERLDFDRLMDTSQLVLDQVEIAMKLPQKATKLQHKTMQNWSDERNVLPEDLHYSGRDFVQLEAMMHTNLAPRHAAQSQSVDDSVADYNFDNLNDTQNFCADVLGGRASSAQDDEVGPPMGEDDLTSPFGFTTTQEQPTYAGEGGLVAAPNRIEKIHIGYAKQAKKVDMRKLKAVEWSILLDRSRNEDDKENASDLNGSQAAIIEAKPSWSASTCFSQLYRDLQRPNLLPSKMAEGLSVPLAFVALLHLCNEQSLALEHAADFNDLKISKG